MEIKAKVWAAGLEVHHPHTHTHDPPGGAVCLRGHKSTVLVKETVCRTYLLLCLKDYFTERCELLLFTCLQTLNTKQDASGSHWLPLYSWPHNGSQWEPKLLYLLLSATEESKSNRFGNQVWEITFKTCMLSFFSSLWRTQKRIVWRTMFMQLFWCWHCNIFLNIPAGLD